MTRRRRNIVIGILAVLTLGLGSIAVFLVVQEALRSQAPTDSSADVPVNILCDEGCNANACICPSSCSGQTITRGEFCPTGGGTGGDGQRSNLGNCSDTCNDVDGCNCPSGCLNTQVGNGASCGQPQQGPACIACVSVQQFGSCGGAGRAEGNGGSCESGQVCCGNLISSPPPPADTRSQCGGACNSPADCRPAANGAPVTCRNGICENSNCDPGKTIPGANCDCSDLNACGQQCGATIGLCQAGSVCRYVSGSSCVENQTYCVPENAPAGWSTSNCVSRDQGNSYVLFNGQNPTQQDILNACNPTCTNGATNPTACNICPSGQVLVNGQCVNNCTNGALNPPTCDQCPTGYTLTNGQCVPPCANGTINPPSCNQCPTGLEFSNNQCICSNGATNAPTCNICPTGEILVNGICQQNSLPDTAVFSDDLDPVLIGMLLLILGTISMKINLPLRTLELFTESDLKYIFAPIDDGINKELKQKRKTTEKEKKKRKLSKDRKKYEDKFKV